MHFSSERVQKLLSAVNRDWRLIDAQRMSPRAVKLELLAEHGRRHRQVLLGHSSRDRQVNPDIARDEFRLLKILSCAGLAVPRPLLVDVSQVMPFLITEFVEGDKRTASADLSVFCDQLAGILSDIHRFSIERHDLSFLPSQRAAIEDNLRERKVDDFGIHAAMRAAWARVSGNDTVLLHGDFWPGNLLWRGDQLAAIIDWEDAMLGDPLGDLGKSRLEVLWALGADAMDLYTSGYAARNPELDYRGLPFWDLWGALRLSHFAKWTAEEEEIARMRAQYERFVSAASAALVNLQE